MSAFLLPNAGGGQEPNRVQHGRLVQYIQNICPLELRDPVTGYIPGTKIIYIFVNRVGTKKFLFVVVVVELYLNSPNSQALLPSR